GTAQRKKTGEDAAEQTENIQRQTAVQLRSGSQAGRADGVPRSVPPLIDMPKICRPALLLRCDIGMAKPMMDYSHCTGQTQ
ncbi:Protein furry, partial [Dissostichus eleginoides]